ncbi:MAG TPA: hypothetical protein VF209_02695 [Patescibacteria group bacterium]
MDSSQENPLMSQLIINSMGDTKDISPIPSPTTDTFTNLNLIQIPDTDLPKSELIRPTQVAHLRHLIRLELEGKKQPILQEPLPLNNEERLSTTETLPVALENILQEVRPDLPIEYREKLRLAAYFFWSLDQGKELYDDQGNSLKSQIDVFIDQLINSGFIWHTFMIHKYFKGPSPKQALPKWINERSKDEPESIDDSIKEKFLSFYLTYVHKVGAKKFDTTKPDDTRYEYIQGIPPRPKKSLALTDNFKAYVEGRNLENTGAIEKALLELQNLNLHPYFSKIFEGDRFVIYWETQPEKEVLQQIRNIFLKHGVHLRGFAQDVHVVVFHPDSSYEVDLKWSNDQSLGEGSGNKFVWEGEQYSLEEFFKQYVRLVTNGTKNPVEPYLLGFTPVITGKDDWHTDEKLRGSVLQLTHQLSQQETLPVFITSRRFIDAFETPGKQ